VQVGWNSLALHVKDASHVKKIICCVLPCLMLCLTLAVFGQAPAGQRENAEQPVDGAAPAPRPDNPQSLEHIAAARKPGNDAFWKYPYDFFCIPANRPTTATPELEPVKLFDNFYAAGNSETTVYALDFGWDHPFDSGQRTENTRSRRPRPLVNILWPRSRRSLWCPHI
jgi:hypothetical protein